MTVLEIKHLDFYFGRQQVLDDVSLTLEKGDVAGLVGNNGAGKTTLMKVVSGILPGGQEQVDLRTDSVGALIEAPALYPNLSVKANLAFYCKLYGKDKTIIDRYKDDLDVTSYLNRKASKLSLGMRQRVGLFIALIASDELILLDEPTNGLDPDGIQRLLGLMEKLAQKHGITFIISSHILANLDQVCTKNYLLKDHKLTQLGDGENAKYKIYTEDLSLKALMALLDKHKIAYERKGYDILVTGFVAISAAMTAEGIVFDYQKEGLGEVLFHD